MKYLGILGTLIFLSGCGDISSLIEDLNSEQTQVKLSDPNTMGFSATPYEVVTTSDGYWAEGSGGAMVDGTCSQTVGGYKFHVTQQMTMMSLRKSMNAATP